MLGSLILDLKGMKTIVFQLSGFYYKGLGFRVLRSAKELDLGVSENRGP